jgi:AcrR family transcriptional regulator
MAGRRPRNIDATRTAILEAARCLFTQQGYGGVGVREIAEGAQADKALITRYFGSKAGLFAEAVPATFDPAALLEGDRADFGRRIATHIVHYSAARDFDPMTATIRSLPDRDACEQLRAGLEEQFIAPLAEWIGTDDAPRRAALLVAQMMGMSIVVNVLSLTPLADLGKEELIELLTPIFQSALEGAG